MSRGTRLALAWIAWAAAGGFWLYAAHANNVAARAFANGASAPDPAHGLTYVLNRHGRIRWLSAADGLSYDRASSIGEAGLIGCLLVVAALARAEGIRAMLRRGAWLLPVIVAVASTWL